jgi:hypothetical protein
MGDSGILHGWIWLTNLRPFVEMVAQLARYRLDQRDMAAIEVGAQVARPPSRILDLRFDRAGSGRR